PPISRASGARASPLSPPRSPGASASGVAEGPDETGRLRGHAGSRDPTGPAVTLAIAPRHASLEEGRATHFEDSPMAKVKPIPEGYPRVMPYLCVDGANAAIDFYRSVFGATERMRMAGPDAEMGQTAVVLAGGVIAV